MPLAKLQPGEMLDGNAGPVAVESVNLTSSPTDVYNVEVHGHHVYRISGDGILVHNAGAGSYDGPNSPTKQLGGMAATEAKSLMSKWSKGTYRSVAKSIRDHARRKGFGNDIPKYLRKAANFNKKGAQRKLLTDGRIRWNRPNGEYLIELAGKIVSYGLE